MIWLSGISNSLEMQAEIEMIQDLEKISRWEQLDITMFVNLFRRIGLGREGARVLLQSHSLLK